MTEKMKIGEHNEYATVKVNIPVTREYPKKLDELIKAKFGSGHEVYITLYTNAKMYNKQFVIRTKAFREDVDILKEIRIKYRVLQQVSLKSDKPMDIIGISVNTKGVSND